MKYRLATLLGIALAMAGVNTGAAEILKYNPFEQPDLNDAGWNGGVNASAETAMKLRGTVIDGSDSLANINGEYYGLNHEVSGYRIVRIESGSVTLQRAGNEMVLTLHDND